MFDTASASNGVKLALLEGQLLTREIDRATFIERAANLGLPARLSAMPLTSSWPSPPTKRLGAPA